MDRYDVIVVGTRVAGAATAMLLARRGLRVAAVDRARFPSDTLSTHQVQLPGVALLRDWGLLDRLAAATPASTTLSFTAAGVTVHGAYPSVDGVHAVYSPRRTLLDSVLVDAARVAGVQLHEGFTVTELTADEGRISGVRGHARGTGAARQLCAPLVIGADGKHSSVARAVGAGTYRARPAASAACYGYFADLPVTGGEVYQLPDRLVGLWPTGDGLTIVYLAVPAAAFPALRADLDAGFRAAVGAVADLGERLAAARPAEHLRATVDLPNLFRRPAGPGWALAGDAGLVMDPISGQGIGNALRDAAALADAVLAGLGGSGSLTAALAGYHRARDTARRPMYDLTTRLAAFRPDPVGAVLFPAIAADPAQSSRFLGVLTGAVPVDEFFSVRNLRRLVGVRGLARIVVGAARPAGILRRAGPTQLPGATGPTPPTGPTPSSGPITSTGPAGPTPPSTTAGPAQPTR
jgi:2-polyprenyl-6-methoxyphenol hydroxylase-like FAD-dependent oxidoreductase